MINHNSYSEMGRNGGERLGWVVGLDGKKQVDDVTPSW